MKSNAYNLLRRETSRTIRSEARYAQDNLDWLLQQMHPYFAITMQTEHEAIACLASRIYCLHREKSLVLADREKSLIVARLNRPGSVYETLRQLKQKEISYAQFSQTYEPAPGFDRELELQCFEFDRKTPDEIREAGEVDLPAALRRQVMAELKAHYPRFDLREFPALLRLLWLNNEQYVRISPPRRIAQVLWLYQQSNRNGGIYFQAEEAEPIGDRREFRLMFGAGNPPQMDFLQQLMEVFNRLKIGVNRAYCLTISNGYHPYFLGTFYVRAGQGGVTGADSEAFARLRSELYNTQILSSASPTYRTFVTKGVMTGEEGSLINAFIAFCHTNLAHHQPDRYGFDDVMRAFHSHPAMALQLVALFRARFDPDRADRDRRYPLLLEETARAIAEHNTGHRYLDEVRRTVFNCCLIFIRHTLKTNFFVPQKQALAFRLDPAYLADLGPDFTGDLPAGSPFRVTFFFGRHGAGYHIGFSDIARGGWRTILTQGWDDYVTSANTIFRETFVLAHTQHLKNKDIYEGGSKLVVVLDAADLSDRDLVTHRLYKLQYGFINAFFDLFVTEDGQARDPRVVDYYGEDEPIELGPDENMHDSMVELIAKQSVRRGYLLGSGVISSKRVGINHKEYGVTSVGVITFAEVVLEELGINLGRDPFSVKFTGGPGGDVAGNAMRLLLDACPAVQIRLVIDGSGALYDPAGADRGELSRLLLNSDIDGFAPEALHPGGFLLYRQQRRNDGVRELFRKVGRGPDGLVESWITLDEFQRDYNGLIFTVPADLFIPAGGRPETVDEQNYRRFFAANGQATLRAVVEGANSFITPAARTLLQQRGIVLLRDASANKCGVISSSYEIIANLLLSEAEFLAHKEEYVADVLAILARRAGDEARLIFRRHREAGGSLLYTEISEAISSEINAHYARLFAYFQQHPELSFQPLFKTAIRSHLPAMLAENVRYRRRIDQLPPKYRFAILASEIASSLVYRGDRDSEFIELLRGHLERTLPGQRPAFREPLAVGCRS
jgi:glutamate dehydrogenase